KDRIYLRKRKWSPLRRPLQPRRRDPREGRRARCRRGQNTRDKAASGGRRERLTSRLHCAPKGPPVHPAGFSVTRPIVCRMRGETLVAAPFVDLSFDVKTTEPTFQFDSQPFNRDGFDRSFGKFRGFFR